jgi:hypothetical protein
MATKLENLQLELAHFDHFKQYLPDWHMTCDTTVKMVLGLGLMQVSTAFEVAIANVGGYEVVSTDAADLSDGSDAKLSCVRTCSNEKSYAAPISNTKNKLGLLRIQVYERKHNKFYYYVVPHCAYKTIPPKSNIEIPFNLDGTPKRVNNCRINWWRYEVKNFVTLCKAKRAYAR